MSWLHFEHDEEQEHTQRDMTLDSLMINSGTGVKAVIKIALLALMTCSAN